MDTQEDRGYDLPKVPESLLESGETGEKLYARGPTDSERQGG
jgi:hypothetical protein